MAVWKVEIAAKYLVLTMRCTFAAVEVGKVNGDLTETTRYRIRWKYLACFELETKINHLVPGSSSS
jgi:hypothetical protein